MSIYKQRDIVLVPFPFSDLSGLKFAVFNQVIAQIQTLFRS
jgi:hypothetical protein